MKQYEIVFSYVKMIVEAEDMQDAMSQAQDAMNEIAMFYDIDRVDLY